MKNLKQVLIAVSMVSLSAQASLVGVLDSGTDMSHKDLSPKAWKNLKEKVGNKDVDGDGLPGDVFGYDYTANKASPFDAQYVNLITNDVKTFFSYYSKYETKTISQTEFQWLKDHANDEKLMNDVDFIGGYIHGTHVAGISAIDNPRAKIMPFKIIPTVYQPLQTSSAQAAKPGINKDNTPAPAPEAPTMTIDQLQEEFIKEASGQVEDMVQKHGVLNIHKVDVVNESFGIGWNDAANFIKSAFKDSIKRDPTADELEKLQRAYFGKLIADGSKMFTVAPNTVFCIAAGNDSSDNDAHPDYPSSIKADNRIVVAATLGYSSLADFSNYGAKNVDVAAPGVAITSTAPGQNYIALSGTSQATPFVTNTIALMKDINPNLKVADIRQIVFGTVDVKPWLKGKVVTSGIVNKARAVKAAELAKTTSVQLAISQAKTLIPDVAVNKSFGTVQLPSLGFKLKNARPSLLLVK